MRRLNTPLFAAPLALLMFASLPACADSTDSSQNFSIAGSDGSKLSAEPLATFDSAWAMTFLPSGHALVTEKTGALWLLNANGKKLGKVSNVPAVTPRGQGGLGDVIAHPDFASNGVIFISYVERDANNNSLSGAAVEKATLTLNEKGGALTEREIIWGQSPKVTGNGHYGHRLAVAPTGHLFITSGERQKFSPAQNMEMNLGKVLRLNQNGTVPKDNPFYASGGVTSEIWTLGHRNPLGIDFDSSGQLWVHEMGPRHGDELNRIVRAENYGYPLVSEGQHYSGEPIPSHASNPAFENPAKAWVPAISPAGFVIYDGDLFQNWQGDGFLGGLSSQALVRVTFEQATVDNTGAGSPKAKETVAKEAARYEWNKRIREVEQGPDGAIYVLEDKAGGRLLRLTPSR